MKNKTSKLLLYIGIMFVCVFVLFLLIKPYVSGMSVVFFDFENRAIPVVSNFFLEGKNNGISFNQEYIDDFSYFFSEGKNIYGLSILGSVEFWSEESFVEVVLVTNKGERLVAEFYPLIFEDYQGVEFNICEETCALDGEMPLELKVLIKNSTLNLNKIDLINSFNKISVEAKNKGIKNYDAELKVKKNKEKVNNINKKLVEKGRTWFAGETEISKLSYAEKKNLYGNATFPPGFEYYMGGVIQSGVPQAKPSPKDNTVTQSTTDSGASASSFVDKWDWRDRHGINWVTPVKTQGSCGSCWAFSAVGATEALVNLYFNQKLDLDLSEQDVFSCSGAGSCSGGWPSISLDYIAKTGVVDERAFPYSGTTEACNNKGKTPDELIKIGGKIDFGSREYPNTEDNLKRLIIETGVVSGGLYDWNHAMALVGYRVVKEGDVFYYRDLNLKRYWKTIGAGDPLIGKTVWIFKNSWGDRFGDDGYVYVETPMNNIRWTHGLKLPVQSLKQPYDVKCVDNDGDGYYWWGLGPKPASCPPNTPDLPDCDDSNKLYGVQDNFGNCLLIVDPVIDDPVVDDPVVDDPVIDDPVIDDPVVDDPVIDDPVVDDPKVFTDFTVDKTIITEGEYVSFTDLSTNSPVSWSWTFNGASPSSSTVKNPVIRYDVAGVFGVSLTTKDSNGLTQTNTKNNYVTVIGKDIETNFTINSEPSGASVYIDGVYRGVTPLFIDDLNVGLHKLILEKEGYVSLIRDFSLIEGENVLYLSLNPVIQGNLLVSSVPTGAKVYINNNLYGVTPLAMNDLLVGTYDLKLTSPSYGDYYQTVNIVNGQTTSVNAVLTSNRGGGKKK